MKKEQVHRISKAIADERRFEILKRIAAKRDEMACAVLTDEFPVTQATMSHHLKELANAGLIEARREAKFLYLCFRRDVWADYLAELKRDIAI